MPTKHLRLVCSIVLVFLWSMGLPFGSLSGRTNGRDSRQFSQTSYLHPREGVDREADRCSFHSASRASGPILCQASWSSRVTKLQSASVGSSPCGEEDMYSFVNSAGQFSPIFQGLPVQVLCWVLGHRAGARQGAKEAEVWPGSLEAFASPRYVFQPPVTWPQSPHLDIKGLLELVPKHLAHTDTSDF